MTALACICCKRYWKERDAREACDLPCQQESHFYRISCSNSNAPLVPFSASFQSNPGTNISSPPSIVSSAATASLMNPLTYPLTIETAGLGNQIQRNHPGYRRLTSSSASSSTTQTTNSSVHPLTLAALLEPPGYPPPPPYTSISTLDRQDEVIQAREDSINMRIIASANNTTNTTNNNNNRHQELSTTTMTVHSIGSHRSSQRSHKTKPLWRKLSQ